MVHLTEDDKAELLEDASSGERRQAFAAMNMRQKILSPLEWLDFLTQASNLSAPARTHQNIMRGDSFLL